MPRRSVVDDPDDREAAAWAIELIVFVQNLEKF
jgi:hypothetical protein